MIYALLILVLSWRATKVIHAGSVIALFFFVPAQKENGSTGMVWRGLGLRQEFVRGDSGSGKGMLSSACGATTCHAPRTQTSRLTWASGWAGTGCVVGYVSFLPGEGQKTLARQVLL